MFEEEIASIILDFGAFLNNIFSAPSRWIPFFSPNLMLIAFSVVFGWTFGRKAFPGFKTISITVLSILIFCTFKWIGVA